MLTTETLYQSLQPYLREPKAGPGQRIWSYCPAHPDGTKHHRRSLSLHPQYGLTCFAGCSFKDILRGLGYQISSPEHPPAQRDTEPDRTYLYTTPEGDVLAEKGRWNKEDGTKTFFIRRPGGKWEDGIKPLRVADLPLYNAFAISKAEANIPVYLVEGEKAADACTRHGLLATTLITGAGGKDFGDALQLLKGRTVALWPDNDPPGREHMLRVHSQLRDIAARVYFLSCPRPLPEKGDAFDYFADGGTPEELSKGIIAEPVVEYLATDSLRILHPTVGVVFEFTFEDITHTRSALETELTIVSQGQRPEEAYFQRINILSSSQRTELRRDLDSIYGKEYDWTRVLNTTFAMARKRYGEMDRSVDAAEIEQVAEASFLVQPLIISDSPNIIFADGGSFKSYLAYSLAVAVATGQRFAGYPTQRARVLVVDYEDNQSNFRRRLRRICDGMGYTLPKNSIYYWPARGIPLRDQAKSLKDKIIKDGIGLIVVDSAGPACGGKPEDAETTLAYFGSLASLNITSLTLCHIPKGGDTEKPFGSTFWHNEARRTWFLQRVQEDDSDEIDLGMTCKKVNDGKRPSPISFHITFEGEEGAVTLTTQAYDRVPELASKLPWQSRILSALTQPMTAQEIADDMGEDKVVLVSKVLSQLVKKGRVVRVGERTVTKGRPPTIWAKAASDTNGLPF